MAQGKSNRRQGNTMGLKYRNIPMLDRHFGKLLNCIKCAAIMVHFQLKHLLFLMGSMISTYIQYVAIAHSNPHSDMIKKHLTVRPLVPTVVPPV